MNSQFLRTYYEPVPHIMAWDNVHMPPDPPWQPYQYRWVERVRGVVVAIGKSVVYCQCRQDYLDLVAHWGGYDRYAARHELGSVYEYYAIE